MKAACTGHRLLPWAPLLALALACAGSHASTDAGNSDGGSIQADLRPEPRDQAQADGGPGEDAEAWEAGQPPILERPASGPYVCSVTRDRTSHVSDTSSGSSFLVLYSLTFHTYAEPGSTVFTCTR